MDKELEELKSVLRSLVVSSPAQVDLRSLLRDYRSIIGAPLPLAKYGYKDPLTFLKDRCKDSFLFHGLPSNPVLTLIVPDTLKHIDNFVQKQKTSSPAIKMKGKRRSVPEPIQRKEVAQDMIYNTFNSNASSPQNINNNRPPDKQEDTNVIKNTLKSNIMNGSNNNNSITSTKSSMDDTNHKTSIDDNKSQHSDNVLSSVYRGFMKNRSPQNISKEMCSRKVSSKESDSGRQTSSSHSSSKRVYLEELRNEIYDIIKDSEDGVWYNDILQLYRERYGREIELERAGFTDLYGVVVGMVERVTSRVVPGGVRLYAHDAAPAAAPAQPRAPHRAASPRAAPGDSLPGVPYEADVFPPDCMKFAESVPPPALGEARPGDLWGVIVGEVYSPSHFWLIRLGERHSVTMENMMDEMAEYYKRGEGRSRWLSRGATRPGHYCSSLYAGDWHRSLIVKIVDSDTVKVRHVDYGTVDTVRVRTLKPLLARWGSLPAQGVRARLAGVRPAAAGRRWPHAAAAHLLHLVLDKPLVAKIVAVDADEDTLEVFLVDTNGAQDAVVSRELIGAGHADPRADSALQTDECYLYPRFEALESGETPNYAEIARYLRDGISLEYVEAYRRHVPPAVSPHVRSSPSATASSSPTSESPPPPSKSPPPPSESPPPSSESPPPPSESPPSPAESPPPPSESPPPPSESRPPPRESPPGHSSAFVSYVPPPWAGAAGRGPPWTPTPRLPAPQRRARLSAEAPEFRYCGPSAQFQGTAGAPPGLGYAPPPGPVFLPHCGWVEPRLRVAEWEIYMTLSRVDPATAYFFLLKAMQRAFPSPPASFPPATPPPPGF